MQLKFLKAGSGDCILVHHNGNNILIDGGNDPKYLFHEIDSIYSKGENIDILIVTHHDDDHIKGILDLLDSIIDNKYPRDEPFIKKVFFNSTNTIINKADKENLLSYKQAYRLEESLSKLNLSSEICTDKTAPIKFDDLTISFLAPTKEDLDKYVEKDPYYLTSDFRCDWKATLQILDKNIDDSSQDKSMSNRTSIVIMLESDDKKALLTGDITPDRLEFVINKLVEENNGEPINFDYVKLPHHGSYKSLNKNILQNIKCHNYVVQTNSTKYFLPNKRAVIKILKYANRSKTEKITFWFNYPQPITNLGITDVERKTYRFDLKPNNETYGLFIR